MKTSAAEPAVSHPPAASTISEATAQSTFISASAAIRRLPSSAFATGSWISTISSVFAEPDEADPALAHARVVLGERRQQREDLVPDRDEEHVQPHEREEVAVAQDGPVAARVSLVALRLSRATAP